MRGNDYVRRPVTVQAFHFNSKDRWYKKTWPEWMVSLGGYAGGSQKNPAICFDQGRLRNYLIVDLGSWIVLDPNGEVSVWTDEAFRKAHDPESVVNG